MPWADLSCGFFFFGETLDKRRFDIYNVHKKFDQRRICLMKYTLYGDGIHDDTAAIQELIDCGRCEVVLPAPEKFYLISAPLILPSNFSLRLPRYAEIRLAEGSNCVMLRNRMVEAPGKRIQGEVYPCCYQLWAHVEDYSGDAKDRAENIEISGGIWNFNNMEQLPNPERSRVYEPHGYSGDVMLFYNVSNLKLSGMTIKDPVHYGVTLDRVSNFTVEDIAFDYNMGNPRPINMDGIHLDGNCHHGVIRNLKGACFDDLVAINAREGSCGDITNIVVDGLFAENCHSAVRLLTVGQVVKNIHITNVFGTYYQYTVALSKFYKGESTGYYDGITLDNIYAAKAPRLDYYKNVSDYYVFSPLWIQGDVVVKNLKIDTVHRREYHVPVETLHIGTGARVERMIFSNVTVENHTGEAMPFVVNHGTVAHLTQSDLVVDGEEVHL